MNQSWYCEACQTEGSVPFEEHTDVYTVVNSLRDDHAAQSPSCESGTFRMRVRTPDCTDAEWQALTGSQNV
jgi:hypothetical protein